MPTRAPLPTRRTSSAIASSWLPSAPHRTSVWGVTFRASAALFGFLTKSVSRSPGVKITKWPLVVGQAVNHCVADPLRSPPENRTARASASSMSRVIAARRRAISAAEKVGNSASTSALPA